jgi:uncharacterized protein (TIRG00374 family)
VAGGGACVSVLALFALAQVVDIRETLRILGRTQAWLLVVVLGVLVLQISLRSVRWQHLLPSRGDHRIPATRLIGPLLAGYLGNVFLPARLGEPVRAYLVARREKMPFSLALGSVTLERILDFATVAVVAWLAALAANAPGWIVNSTGLVAVLGVAAGALLVVVGISRVVRWVESLIGSTTVFARKLIGVLLRFGEGAGGQPKREIVFACAISTVCWLLDGTTFWLVAIAIGVDLEWNQAVLVAGITVLGTALPSAPGYVGTFELAAVAVARALGISAEGALAMAILVHTVQIVPLVIAGVFSLAAMSVTLGELARKASSEDAQSASPSVP